MQLSRTVHELSRADQHAVFGSCNFLVLERIKKKKKDTTIQIIYAQGIALSRSPSHTAPARGEIREIRRLIGLPLVTVAKQ